MNTPDRTALLKRLDDRVSQWRDAETKWRWSHYPLAVTAVTSSSLAAALPTTADLPISTCSQLDLKSTFAVIAAVTTALLTALAPAKKATLYLRARGIVARSINRARVDADAPLTQLLDAEAEADKIADDILA